MKSWRAWLGALVRLGIGVGIVLILINRINKTSMLVEFAVPATDVRDGSVYTDGRQPPVQFMVIQPIRQGTVLRTYATVKAGTTIPNSGRLVRMKGEGPDELAWTARQVAPCGLRRLGDAFREAARNWGFLVAAVAIYFVCLTVCTVRWRVILMAQGLRLTWRQTWAVLFIGHFFNAFMFGATGGDVVKAIYAARLSGHKKAEAVSTVFIDRMAGLVALVLLSASVMLLRLPLFLATPEGRYGLLFVGGLAAVSIVGLGLLVATRRLVGSPTSARPASGGRFRHLLMRVHNAFYICITHPSLVAKTFGLSLLNQFLLVVLMYCLACALRIDRPFVDILALGPVINTIGAIPVTPGGLGLREYAAVTYLALVGVTATKALPLSLSIYTTMLLWSLVGGVVFLLYNDRAGIQPLKEAAREEG